MFDQNVKPYDQSMERAILAGIKKYPDQIYEIGEIISYNDYAFSVHAIIQTVFEKIVIDDDGEIDPVTFSAKLKEMDIASSYGHKVRDIIEVFTALDDIEIAKRNLLDITKKIKKMQIIRQYAYCLAEAQVLLQELTGNEPIEEIISLAEKGVFDTTISLTQEVGDVERLGTGFMDYANQTAANPVDIVGLPTGFSIWDEAIGGLRRKTTDLIGARPKRGKSSFAVNVARYLSLEHNLPVLYLDTELDKMMQRTRFASCITEIPIKELETGRWGQNKDYQERVKENSHNIENAPVFFRNVAGMNIDEYLSIMRRWVVKEVGRDEDGQTNDCLIILDWLKLIDIDAISKDVKEYQYLGYMLSRLHDFAVIYDLPILTFVQLNREGISKDTEDVLSGSDRLTFLCDSLSLISNKTKEEIYKDGIQQGDKKIKPILCRHGEGIEDTDWINLRTDLSRCLIIEGELQSTLDHPGGHGDNNNGEKEESENTESEDS